MKIALVIGLFVVVAAIVKLIDDDAQEPGDDPTTQLASETSSARDGSTGEAGRAESNDPPERWTPENDDPPAGRGGADPNPKRTDPAADGLRPAGAEDVGGVTNASYPTSGAAGSDVLAQLYREAGFDPDSVLEPSPGDGDGASDPADDLGGPPLETGADLDPIVAGPPTPPRAETESSRAESSRAESSRAESSRAESPRTDPTRATTSPAPREGATAPSVSGFPKKYTLVEGDTVWDLSKAMYGSHEFVKEILAANPSLGDGSSVRAGIEITLPAIARAPAAKNKEPEPTLATGQRSHTVAKGDNLYRLAERYLGQGIRWPDIVAANPGIDPDHLPVGEPIIIPPK